MTVEWETEVSLLRGYGGAGGIVAICSDYWIGGMSEVVKRDWFHLSWDISSLHTVQDRDVWVNPRPIECISSLTLISFLLEFPLQSLGDIPVTVSDSSIPGSKR